MVAREELLLILKAVLSRHGAVPMSSSLVGYAGAETPPNSPLLLARDSSSILALRHEMRTPFAAWLARQVSPLPLSLRACTLPVYHSHDTERAIVWSCVRVYAVPEVAGFAQDIPSLSCDLQICQDQDYLQRVWKAWTWTPI